MNRGLLAQLVILFIITQAMGLAVGDFLINEQIRTSIVNDDPESVDNSLGLIAWVLVFTAMLILVIRFAPEWLLTIILKGIESLTVFGTSIIVLLPTKLADEIILGAAALSVAVRIIFSKNIWLRNASSVVAAAGAGALIGASLGVVAVFVFIVLLAIYDFIAVFKTKHMVQLAKTVTSKNLSFTYALPTPSHQFELGTGDLVMPLVFASSVLAAMQPVHQFPYSIIPSIAVLAASYVGLVLTLDYVSKREGTALPALPPQTILMLLTFGALKLIGF
ncbi:MAG TPA: hypothetical protein HA254_05820 [Candidatus Diapherotrites archaeon]|uniref:Uncharacterized protein n=1 Tax=Candidatus Iainarchaeum sp. TaxID=3101447 RepID=A0A7J4IZ49_9ARCH|nr:hypothetical protein [Candidatus Diapherotrites archaeon]